ncbi:hypothetical protein [Burkholderia singularis]|uniref:hypothetical protein n=1 Tax=Burkholderia singularis TaxID=1503053 RepID=UPI002115C369|nr:hypothetical protein [Burkholderia singularis]
MCEKKCARVRAKRGKFAASVEMLDVGIQRARQRRSQFIGAREPGDIGDHEMLSGEPACFIAYRLWQRDRSELRNPCTGCECALVLHRGAFDHEMLIFPAHLGVELDSKAVCVISDNRCYLITCGAIAVNECPNGMLSRGNGRP